MKISDPPGPTLSAPSNPVEEASDKAKDALGRAQLQSMGVGAGGVFTGLGYLGYKAATEGPLEFLIPDHPSVMITVVLAAVTIGFAGAATKNLANAARWATVAGARRFMSGPGADLDS